MERKCASKGNHRRWKDSVERIKHGNVLMTIDDENKQEALELAKRFCQHRIWNLCDEGYGRII